MQQTQRLGRKTAIGTRKLVLGVFVLGLTMASPGFAQMKASVPKGPHGAAHETYQEKNLAALQQNQGPVEEVPMGIDEEYWKALIPEGNDTNQARVDLGRKLYFDPRLSIDDTVSCATCHDVMRGFGDALPTSEGVDKKTEQGTVKQMGTRNAPTTMNIALYHSMFWDGRSPTVEHQAMQPIINPVEMGMPDDANVIISKIKNDPEYQTMFQEAYGRDVNYPDIGNALAAFERTLIFMDNPFFQNLQESPQAAPLSQDALAGWVLFNREGRCNSCHQISPVNPLGTDNKFHNIGIAALHQNFEGLAAQAQSILAADSSEAKLDELALTTDMGELGRFLITKNVTDMGAFRTPMLLNVGVTGPYMHDGSFETLWDVIDHYNKGGVPNLYLDGGIEPLNLTDKEVDQLVAFLFSLTDVRLDNQNRMEYERQRRLAQKNRPERNKEMASRQILTFEQGIVSSGAASTNTTSSNAAASNVEPAATETAAPQTPSNATTELKGDLE